MGEVLFIDEVEQLVGVGLHRKCYVHPEKEELCIKIGYNSNPKEDKRELQYYDFLSKRSISWDMLPRYHGVLETNLGEGTVFDLIRDEDGSISKTLEYYLEKAEGEVDKKHLQKALNDLKEYLLSECILTMTIKSKNIVYKKNNDSSGRLIIVDNIGYSELIPLCKISSYFGRKKILRKWAKFEKYYQQFF